MSERKFRGARFGVFEADFEVCELRKHGIRIRLTGQPFQALLLLLEHTGEVVTREEFCSALWPDRPWGEHDQRLNKIVNKIREALCDSAETPRFLETIPRIGYRFLVQVEHLGSAPEAMEVPEPPLPPPPSPPEALAPAAVAVPERRYTRLLWLALGCVLVTTVVAAGLSNRFSLRAEEKIRVGEPAPLTTYIGSELYPSLSPDGRQVVFAWDGESKTGSHIYTAPVPGGSPRRITNDSASDASPVWSPGGTELAFLREASPGTSELWLIHADGTGARKLREVRTTGPDQSLAWTKDQKWLIVSQKSLQNGVPALFRISTASGEEHQITAPSFAGQSGGDLSPAISPDGTKLAFTRSTSPAWRDIFVMSLPDDRTKRSEPVRVTDAHTIIDHVAWTPDGQSFVFSAATSLAGSRHLFRVSASRPGTPAEATPLRIEGDHPTLAGSPFRLAFVRKNIEQSSIWRLELDRADAQPRPSRMISSTRRDFTTDLSPDGVHIVFSSVRSGPTEIWMSEKDGSNLRCLTSIGGMAPRWSPDGKRIAFESFHRGQPDIYVLTLEGGSVQRLTSEGPFNVRPSWSRDGRFIYFCSNRTSRPQIWKVPSEGGDAVQITRHGGQYAVETFDRKSIYFTTPDLPSQLWTTAVNGGDETMVIPKAAGYAGIASSRDGLYYLSSITATSAQLDFYRFANHTSRRLAAIDHPVHRFLSSSPDGRSVLYTQVDRQDSDLMLVDPWR